MHNQRISAGSSRSDRASRSMIARFLKQALSHSQVALGSLASFGLGELFLAFGASGSDFWIDLASFGGRFGVDLGLIWMGLTSIWVDFIYCLHLFWGSRFDAKNCATSALNVFLRQFFGKETFRRSEKISPP